MEDAGKLIRQAFQRAKHAGKADWNEMTSAVLKSRMLDITGNNFNEADYGYFNFTEFLICSCGPYFHRHLKIAAHS